MLVAPDEVLAQELETEVIEVNEVNENEIMPSLQELRIKAGFKKSYKFAKKMNISPSYYSRVENGKDIPSVKLLHKMSQILNCEFDKLLKLFYA